MHETRLLENIFKYLAREEGLSSRKIKKVYLSLSEFAGFDAKDFKAHYKDAAAGTKWASLDLEIKKVPYGPELEITRLDFA
jgi:Zn finger protein HypA/HybF involved in hydrogenase expression